MNFNQFKSSELLNLTGASSSLTDREKHMIGLAVTATRGCIKCTGSRIKKAKDAGIEEAAILDALDLAAAVNAGVTLAIAIQGADMFNETLKRIEPECNNGVCTIGV